MGSDPSKTNPDTLNDEFLEILDLDTPTPEQHVRGQIKPIAVSAPSTEPTHAPIALPEFEPDMAALLDLGPVAPNAAAQAPAKADNGQALHVADIAHTALPLEIAQAATLSVPTTGQQNEVISHMPPPAAAVAKEATLEPTAAKPKTSTPDALSAFEPMALGETSTTLQMAHTATLKLPQSPTTSPRTATPAPAQDKTIGKASGPRRAVLAGLVLMGAAATWTGWFFYTRAANEADQDSVQPRTIHAITPTATDTEHAKTDWWQQASIPPLPSRTTPQAQPLTWKTVDAADYFSLQQHNTALATETTPENQALQTWVRFRLAKSYHDDNAQKQLEQSLKRRPSRHPTPWQHFHDATVEMGVGRPKNAIKLLARLPKTMAHNPQVQWLSILAQAQIHGASGAMAPQVTAKLTSLVRQSPDHHDARLLQARRELEDPVKRSQWVHSAQVAQIWQQPDTQAALADLLLQHHAYDQLDAILAPPDLTRSDKLFTNWAKASLPHQNLLWQLHISRHLRMLDLQTAWWLAQAYAHILPEQTAAKTLQTKMRAYLFAEADPHADASPSFQHQILQACAQLFDNLNPSLALKPVIFTPKLVEQSTHLLEPWPQWVTFAQKGDWARTAFFIDAAFWLDPMAVAPLDLARLWMVVANAAGQSQAVQARGTQALTFIAQAPREHMVTLLANLAHAAHQRPEQIHWLEQLLQNHPDNPDLTLSLAEALVDLNRTPQALQALEHLAQINPQISHDPQFLTLEAKGYLGQNNPVQARSLLLAAAHIRPSVETYLQIAELEQARGHLDDSAEAVGQALALEPERTDLALRLARIQVGREQYPQAIQTLQTLLKKAPEMGEASELLADVMHTQGNLQQAQQLYLDALKALGERAPLLLKLALLQLHELKDLPAALQTLERAVKIDPKLAETYYYLGMARHDSNQPGQAKEALQTYLRLSPQGSLAVDAKEALRSW